MNIGIFCVSLAIFVYITSQSFCLTRTELLVIGTAVVQPGARLIAITRQLPRVDGLVVKDVLDDAAAVPVLAAEPGHRAQVVALGRGDDGAHGARQEHQQEEHGPDTLDISNRMWRLLLRKEEKRFSLSFRFSAPKRAKGAHSLDPRGKFLSLSLS